MHLKLFKDGIVVDAVLIPCFVKYDHRKKLFLATDEYHAEGIASHDGETYYQLADRPSFGVEGYITVTVEETTEEEAAAIIAALDAGKPAPLPDPDPDSSVELLRDGIIRQMSDACNAAITAGVDVEFPTGVLHFSLRLEDQLNLISLQGMIATGLQMIPYHADGGECRYFSVEEFTAIATAATNWKIFQESYYNSLRAYIRSMDDKQQLLSCVYGMPIPEEYQTDVLKQFLQGGA